MALDCPARTIEGEAHLFVLFQLDHANPFRPYKDGRRLLLAAFSNIFLKKIPPLPTESQVIQVKKKKIK